MTLSEIKCAVNEGKTVCWSNERYEVVKNRFDMWYIQDVFGKSCIGLTWLDGVTMNGEEKDFFVKTA